MSVPLRVGVIGCGDIARAVHLPVLTQLSTARVTAVADPQPAARRAAAESTGAAECEDPFDVFDRADVDVVLVASPPDSHATYAVATIEAGKALYVEKPIATTLADGRLVLSAWEQHGSIAMVGLNFRFHPLHVEARARVRAGKIGRVVAVRSAFTTYAGSRPGWAAGDHIGAGALGELAAHELDLVRFVTGREIVAVRALEVDGSPRTSVTLQLRLDDGAVADILVSLDSVEHARLEVYGDNGKLECDRYGSLRVRTYPSRTRGIRDTIGHVLGDTKCVRDLIRRTRAPRAEVSYGRAWSSFLDAIMTNTPASPGLEDGWAGLALLAAADESLRTGREVVPELRAPVAAPGVRT